MAKTILRLGHLPPSVNHIYRRTKHGGVMKTQRYMTWLNAEGWGVAQQMRGQRRWDDRVYLTIAFRRDRHVRDLDNLLKGSLDLLVHHRVVTDDSLFDGINAYWSDKLPSGVAVELAITAADPAAGPGLPVPQHRTPTPEPSTRPSMPADAEREMA